MGKFRYKIIQEDLYNCFIIMCYGPYKDWKKFIKKEYGMVKEDDDSILYTIQGASISSVQQIKKPGNFHYIMWVSSKTDMLSIVHEAIHTGFHILSDKGVKYDVEHSEVVAYYIEFIVKTFLKL